MVGGITKFKPIHQILTIRDALWAAANRAENAAQFAESNKDAVQADIFHICQLLSQCKIVAPGALKDGSMDQATWNAVNAVIARVDSILDGSQTSITDSHKVARLSRQTPIVYDELQKNYQEPQ